MFQAQAVTIRRCARLLWSAYDQRCQNLVGHDAAVERRLPRLADAAWEMLPPAFKQMCGTVVIQVTDFAPEEVLEHFKMDSPYELTGLYHGVDLTQKSISDPAPEPDYVFLYRLPILLEWCERSNVTLSELITHVLIHEIGHHFGLRRGHARDRR
jgi:predicted Zn-dependent protease with MMP-like domain